METAVWTCVRPGNLLSEKERWVDFKNGKVGMEQIPARIYKAAR